MNRERQPLLGQSAAPSLSDPPTTRNVSADTALVNVHSDDDGILQIFFFTIHFIFTI